MATCSKLFSLVLMSLLLTSCFESGGVAPVFTEGDDEDFVTPCITCKIFLTSGTFNGNLGGVSGADQKCNDDAQSGRAPYKAFLAGRGGDWVLQANTLYVRSNGSTIGTTDGSARLVFPFTNGPIGTGLFWSGFGTNWATEETCVGWTDSSNVGDAGDSGAITNGFLRFSTAACTNAYQLLCVQQ